MSTQKKEIKKISDIFNNMINSTEESEDTNITFGKLLESLGNRSFGPMILVPGLLAAFPPIGGIPGMSIFTAMIIIVISAQLLFGQKYLWLPKGIKNRELDREKFQNRAKKLISYVKKLEKIFKPRLKFFSSFPFAQILAFECIALSITMFPLAFIPFGVTLPAMAIIFLSAGLTTKDGLMIVLGNIFFVGSLYFVWSMSGEILEILKNIGIL